MDKTGPPGIHCDIQRNGITSLQAHPDEAPTILLCDEDRRPQSRSIDQRHPPEPTNVRQLQDVVQAISSAWRRDESEDPEENLDGDVVDGAEFWEG